MSRPSGHLIPRRRRRALAAAPACVWLALTAAAAAQEPAASVAISGAAGCDFVPGRWALLSASAVNPGLDPVVLHFALAFDHLPATTFQRQVWVPPNARRNFHLPVLPTQPGGGRQGRSHGVRWTLSLLDGEQRQALAEKPALLAAHPAAASAAVLCDQDLSMAVARLLLEVRTAQGVPEPVPLTAVSAAPAQVEGWGPLDFLVLADPAPGMTAAQKQAVRHWVAGGGRLWIMLDRTGAELPAGILGDDGRPAVIDRVPLSQVAFDDAEPGSGESLDPPAEMVRALLPGFEAVRRIGGHPAAAMRTLGRGSVLITTLDAQGWLSMDRLPGRTGGILAQAWNGGRGPTDPPRPAGPPLDDYVSHAIGARILPRGVVALVLLSFTASLGLLGWRLRRRGRLERLATAGALAAVAATAVLLGLGLRTRRQTPPTLATAALVRVLPEQGLASVQGTVGVYSPMAGQGLLVGQGPLYLRPDLANSWRSIRFHWTDLNRWEWRNLELPAGAVGRSDFQGVLSWPRLPRPRIDLTAAGLTVASPGTATLEDALLVLPGGIVRLVPTSPGAWTAGPEHLVIGDRFLADAATDSLDATRRQRLEVYRRWLGGATVLAEPTLLGWVASENPGLSIGRDARQTHTSLLAVPARFQRPPAGARFTLSGPCLGWQVLPLASRPSVHGAWRADAGRWAPWVGYGTLSLRFTVPAELLPLELEEARLLLDIEAPHRTVSLVAAAGDEGPALATLHSPSGSCVLPLRPTLDACGRIPVELWISPDQDRDHPRPWHIKRLALEVSARCP